MYTSLDLLGSTLLNTTLFILSLLLDKPSHPSIEMAGLTSLLGGDDALFAMIVVHVYGNRPWLGWYNTPGSFQIVKRLNSFLKSTVSGGKDSSKSVQSDPTALLELDSCKGPKYRAAHSGTTIKQTGYLGALFMKECAAWDSEGNVVPGQITSPVRITIAELGNAPAAETEIPLTRSSVSTLFAGIPIISSISACIVSALCGDWYAASLILGGTVTNGLFGLVLGCADLVFIHPEPAKGSPSGDGIFSFGEDIVVLKGTEGAVNSITRGRFSLRFSSTSHYGLVRWCSIFYFVQSITQLFLIHQASLFGQIMFLASIAISASYNARLSLSDKEGIHQKMLFGEVLEKPKLTKYTLGTHIAAAVFILLVLQPENPARLLDELLPDSTKVWKQWKMRILGLLRHPNGQLLRLAAKVRDMDGFTQQEKELLGSLYGDATMAYNEYRKYRSL